MKEATAVLVVVYSYRWKRIGCRFRVYSSFARKKKKNTLKFLGLYSQSGPERRVKRKSISKAYYTRDAYYSVAGDREERPFEKR